MDSRRLKYRIDKRKGKSDNIFFSFLFPNIYSWELELSSGDFWMVGLPNGNTTWPVVVVGFRTGGRGSFYNTGFLH